MKHGGREYAWALVGGHLAGEDDKGVGIGEVDCALGLEGGSAWGLVRGIYLDCWRLMAPALDCVETVQKCGYERLGVCVGKGLHGKGVGGCCQGGLGGRGVRCCQGRSQKAN